MGVKIAIFKKVVDYSPNNLFREFKLSKRYLFSFTDLETRMSKGASGVRFDHVFLQSAGFFDLNIVERRQTRRLKAEISYFPKIKFSRPSEYSTPVEYSTDFHLWAKITVSIRPNYGKNKKFQFQSPNVV